jgi:hypothetical protein
LVTRYGAKKNRGVVALLVKLLGRLV